MYGLRSEEGRAPARAGRLRQPWWLAHLCRQLCGQGMGGNPVVWWMHGMWLPGVPGVYFGAYDFV